MIGIRQFFTRQNFPNPDLSKFSTVKILRHTVVNILIVISSVWTVASFYVSSKTGNVRTHIIIMKVNVVSLVGCSMKWYCIHFHLMSMHH